MDIKENIKTGIVFVGDTVSEFAAAIAEKNRLRVQLNKIKAEIKADSSTRDQAYIELGRFFYENLREGAAPENEALCAVIDAASDRISAASIKYVELLNQQNETKIRSENAEKLKQIVAAKAAASAKAAKEKGAEIGQKAKEKGAEIGQKAAELGQKAKIAATELKDKAAETVDEVKDRFNPERNAELEALIAEEQLKIQEAQTADTAEAAEKTEAPEPAPEATPAAEEESPEAFDF